MINEDIDGDTIHPAELLESGNQLLCAGFEYKSSYGFCMHGFISCIEVYCRVIVDLLSDFYNTCIKESSAAVGKKANLIMNGTGNCYAETRDQTRADVIVDYL